MKTKQELLDFYGVEIGKKYIITKTRLNSLTSKIFTIEEDKHYFGGLKFMLEDGVDAVISILNGCCYEEIKPSILDDEEKEYLQKYVMDNPAFKGKVVRIQKRSDKNGEGYLAIWLDSEPTVFFPNFELDTMYEGMTENIKYTPKELGLEE